MKIKIGFGGSCHWCTEAIFQSLKGVFKVEQGWISSPNENAGFSEAVIVHFDDDEIALVTLMEIHLHTHSCTANHSMRAKYRSAVYCFGADQIKEAQEIINDLQQFFTEKIITEVLPFVAFKVNEAFFLNYYFSNPEKPFCQNIINPKLKLLMEKFSTQVQGDKLKHLENKI